VRTKSDNPARHFIIAFLIALVIYLIAYQTIQHRRTRKGPWEVSFSAGSNGAPTMVINQAKLGITNVQIIFPGNVVETNGGVLPNTLVFDKPQPVPYDVPFGKCIFTDLTFLPGSVTFSNVFGHEIELLPRVLIIDYKAHPWSSETLLNVADLPKR
jgi:hypothetical protein